MPEHLFSIPETFEKAVFSQKDPPDVESELPLTHPSIKLRAKKPRIPPERLFRITEVENTDDTRR